MYFSSLLSLLCALIISLSISLPLCNTFFKHTNIPLFDHLGPFVFYKLLFFSSTFFSYFLLSPFRLVHSGPGKTSPLLDSELSFGLRSGTKQGVETHVFRVDSAKDLSTWTHLLVEGCHNAAELIKEVTTGTDTANI